MAFPFGSSSERTLTHRGRPQFRDGQKKEKQCDPEDPADPEQGSYWDHVILDPETKLIVSLVVGRRNADSVVQLFTDFYGRTDGHLPQLIVTDEYAPYKTVILVLL